MTTTLNESIAKAQSYYPKLTVAYKDESYLMKILDKLVFFSSDFSTYTTTIGSTIYFPSKSVVEKKPDQYKAILCHELSHFYSSQKKTSIFYSLYYLFPQILVFAAPIVLIFFSFFKALLCLLFLLPLPSPTRKAEEQQAYTISLYIMNKLNNLGSNFDLDNQKENIVSQFAGPAYYFMWWLPGMEIYFNATLDQIKLGEKPNYDAALYTMVDDVVGG